MLKKIFLCLLLTTDLYPVERSEHDKLIMSFTTAMVIGAGVIVVSLYSLDADEFEELKAELNSGEPKKLSEIINFGLLTASAVMGVFAIPDLCSISKEIYEYTFPTEEQRAAKEASIIAATANIKFYEERVKFRDCLMKHKSGCEKNALGRPDDCEELAQVFIACGGAEEVDRMTEGFKEFWK